LDLSSGSDLGRRLLYISESQPGLREAGEEFARVWLEDGNKSTVNAPLGDGRIAIFAAPSTCPPNTAISMVRPSRSTCFAGAQELTTMRQLNAFLRATPSRIGRRLALIVAIAAASLPSAGA
jgi:hypothetical protein